jgi:hypothetical protein
MRSKFRVFAAALLILSMPALAASPKPTERAKSIFGSYETLERSFDARVADLYCDTALIRNTRTYPDGNKRTLEFPAPKYKELIRTSMPLAKAAGDYGTYSDVTYTVEGANVRILSTRYSNLKKYTSPLSILVGSCNGGEWAILEEISESQP